MTYLCPVPLSAASLSALRDYMACERAEAKRLILCGDRIEQAIRDGKARRMEREGIEYTKSIAEICTAGGGWDRSST